MWPNGKEELELGNITTNTSFMDSARRPQILDSPSDSPGSATVFIIFGIWMAIILVALVFVFFKKFKNFCAYLLPQLLRKNYWGYLGRQLCRLFGYNIKYKRPTTRNQRQKKKKLRLPAIRRWEAVHLAEWEAAAAAADTAEEEEATEEEEAANGPFLEGVIVV